jgi:hypothetical protein
MPTTCVNRARLIAATLLLGLLAGACAGPEVAEAAAPEAAAGAPLAALAPPPTRMPVGDVAVPVVDRNGRMLVEAMEYPWSAIGRLNTGGRGFCSGVLIGPRLVLASARCLFDAASGRWWPSSDLRFVAGYQRDRSVIHAGVRAYEVAPDFVPGTVNTFANLANNWALLSLDTAIGYAAGWLAVQWQDEETRARLADGDGLLLAAGYRRGWGNVITVDLECAERACAGSPVEAALPAFVYLDDEFRVLGNPLLRTGATVGTVFSPDFTALPRGDAHWGDSQPPLSSVVAAALPRNSIARLLRHLGYLTIPETGVDDRILTAAIQDFEIQSGLRRDGIPSVTLLGHLLEATLRELARADTRPQSRGQPPADITRTAAGRVY